MINRIKTEGLLPREELMRSFCFPWLILGLAAATCAAQVQHTSHPGLAGCISQDATGSLHLVDRASGRVFSLQGNTNLLLHHLNQLVRVPAASTATGNQTINVNSLSVISESCASALPPKQHQPVEGKVGAGEKGVGTANSASATTNTAGFQTEESVAQGSGKYSSESKALQGVSSPFRPAYPEQAGESEAAANTNAEAATRAEMYPGTTLGVDVKSAPPSSVQSLQSNPTTQRQMSKH